jgi:hypothetical protein
MLYCDQYGGKRAHTLGVLQAVKDGFAAIEAKMATKNDLKNFATKHDLTALKTETAGLIQGEFATFRTELIDPMQRDLQAIKTDVRKIRDTFAPRLEFDDRLRLIEQKLGIPSPH